MGRKRRISDADLESANCYNTDSLQGGSEDNTGVNRLHAAGESYDMSASTAGEKDVPVKSSANARERARMRLLSRAFCRLKTTLPWVPPDTKLSKLDTLR